MYSLFWNLNPTQDGPSATESSVSLTTQTKDNSYGRVFKMYKSFTAEFHF